MDLPLCVRNLHQTLSYFIQASGNSVFGIPNYVDIVTGQSKSNPVSQTTQGLQYVYQDPSQMFSLQQSQLQHQQLQLQPEMLTQVNILFEIDCCRRLLDPKFAIQNLLSNIEMNPKRQKRRQITRFFP